MRLVGRMDVNGFVTGALQIFVDGAFGAICSTSFGLPDADVACRQMGFVGGAFLPLAIVSGSSGKPVGGETAERAILEVHHDTMPSFFVLVVMLCHLPEKCSR